MTAAETERPVPSTFRAGVAGLLAGAAALSIGELAGALAAPRPGPVVAVANRVIDNAPTWFVDFGKAVFGLADKPALVLGTIIVSLAAAIGLGVASRRRLLPGVVGIGAFGLIGLLAIATDAQGGWGAAIPVTAAAVIAGIAALAALMRRAVPQATVTAPEHGDADEAVVTESPTDPALTRRGFFNLAGAVGASAAIATAGANVIRARSSATDARDAVRLDSRLAESELSAQISAAGTTDVASTPGITPLIVPNDQFYLIDTAVLTPQVNPANWELRIKGMVDNEISYSYQELLDRATMVEPVTLSCVSNEVGGQLVGNAVWQGVPLTELLEEAGIRPGATQIASRSVDGWSCGFPTEVAYDGRTSMVAIAMNDEPLPLRHGFPARLVVSGLYGYVSATKWVSEIELTTLEDFDGYWIPRGWSKLGPVKTQSRIDTPRTGTPVTAGAEVPIAGVAWAPHIGIERIEVQIDDDEWQEAELGESLGTNAWRQWVLRWTATEGRHLIRVRATDASGYTQTSELAPPAPSGATGWHQITVTAA
ncbi:MAG: molybdopterin-dependent oxidoreductase [Acidimicrobiia bacterium]|nr:molybdopterin-dependent oxidoreductase [Acidimicrobiia bacterium]